MICHKCQDGIKHSTEFCDDGNSIDTDSCQNSCSAGVCSYVSKYGSTTCCGNGVKDTSWGEKCDDSNENSNDGCS